MYNDKTMTTKEVAEKYGITRNAVIRWCKKNSIQRNLGKNGVMEYDLNKKDLINFENRKGKGWKKGRPRKIEKT